MDFLHLKNNHKCKILHLELVFLIKPETFDFNLPEDRLPQAQVDPAGLVFSALEREQVQWPAGR